MKTIANCVTVVKDGKVTITADIVEKDFTRFPVQRSTVGYLNPDNIEWPRHIQISNEAVFVKAFAVGVAMSLDDLVAIAAAVEPKTSYPPKFKKADSVSVEIASELSPSFQWQSADDIRNPVWQDIPGAVSSSLDAKMVQPGKFVRCVAKSDAGEMYSRPVMTK